jgi:hypothetical protein
MKIYIFVRGFDSITMDDVIEHIYLNAIENKENIIQSAVYVIQEQKFSKDTFSGVFHMPVLENNIHMYDIWTSVVENPDGKNDRYFILSRENDQTFKALGFINLFIEI